MSAGLVLLFTAVAIVFIVIGGVFAIYVGRNFPTEKFDERQKINRGDAYRFSHWMGMIYYFGLLVYFVFHTGKSEWAIESCVLLFIGILIQLQSFHIYCLMTHSALPLGEKPISMIVSYTLMGGMYLAQYYLQYIPENTVGLEGAESMNLFRLLCSFNFFTLALLHLIAHLRKERE